MLLLRQTLCQNLIIFCVLLLQIPLPLFSENGYCLCQSVEVAQQQLSQQSTQTQQQETTNFQEEDTCLDPQEQLEQIIIQQGWDNIRASEKFRSSKAGSGTVTLDLSHLHLSQQSTNITQDSQQDAQAFEDVQINVEQVQSAQQIKANVENFMLNDSSSESMPSGGSNKEFEQESSLDQSLNDADNMLANEDTGKQEEDSTISIIKGQQEEPIIKLDTEDDYISEEDELNVASDKAGAKVLAANKEAKKPQKVIDSDLDTFMMNECAAEKWIILELSQRAIVRRIGIAVTELYSSRVRDFQVYGRERHPRYDNKQGDYSKSINSSSWTLIGNFTADNRRGPQVFTVDFHPENHQVVQWILFKFLTHYGTEPVCALNDLKVYGLTEGQMLENRLLHLHKVTQIIDDQQQQQQQQLLQNEEIPSQTNGQVADESDNTSVEEEPVVITQIVQVDTGGQTQCDVDRIIFGNDSDTNLTCCNIDVCFPQDEMVEVRKTLADSSQETSTQPPNEEQKQPQMEFPKTLENTLYMNTPKPVQGHIQGSVYDKIINEMISLKLNQTYTWKQNQEMSESINNLQKTVEVLNQSLSVQIEQRQQEASQQRDQTMKLQQVTNQQSIQLAELNLHIEQLETKYQNLMQIIENQEQQGQQILNISRIMLGVVVGVGLMVLPWVSFEPKVVWLLFIASVGVIGVLITMRMALAEGWQATTLKAALSCVNHCLAKRS
eukprot:TRINITY_DN1235_c0_g1_i4.p1 TRINITY_DN1235_c0_g1~~TRINITY_DN1235_c0_g1_i4.p1  ORF type:complete len:721 (-),score=80.43 TRINITY_DN1235_c0_g1_i4:1425-3587(-)